MVKFLSNFFYGSIKFCILFFLGVLFIEFFSIVSLDVARLISFAAYCWVWDQQIYIYIYLLLYADRIIDFVLIIFDLSKFINIESNNILIASFILCSICYMGYNLIIIFGFILYRHIYKMYVIKILRNYIKNNRILYANVFLIIISLLIYILVLIYK